MKKEQGFTMIELVVSIVIIVLLSVKASSLFFSLSTYNNQLWQDQVKSTIEYARKLAVNSGNYIQVSVTSTTLTLQIVTVSTMSGCSVTNPLPIVDPVSNTSGYTRTAPGRATLSYSANFPIYFNSSGQALNVSTCAMSAGVITINATGMSTMTLYPQTGFIQ